MTDLVKSLTGVEQVFLFCAILGGILFVSRTILLFAGGGHDFHTGDVSGADIGSDTGDVGGHDADASFKLLSFQGLTAFFMMFGLVGLALSKQSGIASVFAIFGGVVAGIASVWVISKIFSLMQRLQSSGTLKIENAIGQEGTVYLNIPAGGTGKIQVSVQNQLMMFDAVSNDSEIKTGERVMVVRVIGGNVMVVQKVS